MARGGDRRGGGEAKRRVWEEASHNIKGGCGGIPKEASSPDSQIEKPRLFRDGAICVLASV